MGITGDRITGLSLYFSNRSCLPEKTLLKYKFIMVFCPEVPAENSKIKLQTACFYVLVLSSLPLKARVQKSIALSAVLENTSQVPDNIHMTLNSVIGYL